MIYYVASRWRDAIHNPMTDDHAEREGVVWRLNPTTYERTEVSVLQRPGEYAQYVSRGAVDHNGNLFFGHVGPMPVGIFKVDMPVEYRRPDAHLPIRIWG